MSDRAEREELVRIYEEKERRKATRKILSYYPDDGPLRRELYAKHVAFFAAGKTFLERLFMAANRVGKTEGAGGFETTCHLTGDYPLWWPGKVFNKAVDWWAAGDTSETVRDIIQLKLMGDVGKGEIGTGLIPADKIIDYSRRRGISDALDAVYVKHASGGVSQIAFKSYDQGRKAFQGTKKDGVWLDEEPDEDIYTECLLRITGTEGEAVDADGISMLTFTPLSGMSQVVMSFLPGGRLIENAVGTKIVITATWDDVPHLSAKTKEALWNAMPPYQREARSKGVPQLGSGAIYPVQEEDILVDDFPIPDHWPRVYAFDVGWNRTAALWGAWDREADVVYLISEHYRGQAEPVIHAEAIKSRGAWIPGVIDPAAAGANQKDGTVLMDIYKAHGLDLQPAFNGVESGIQKVWERLSGGRLKVFKSLSNWRFEFRLYRRDEKGKIVKENDHLMDTMRYLVMSGLERAVTKPVEKEPEFGGYGGGGSTGWMG